MRPAKVQRVQAGLKSSSVAVQSFVSDLVYNHKDRLSGYASHLLLGIVFITHLEKNNIYLNTFKKLID